MVTHSSILAWRIPGTAEPDGLPSLGSYRIGHDWSDLAAAAAPRPHLSIVKPILKLCVCLSLITLYMPTSPANAFHQLKLLCSTLKWSVSCSVVPDSLQPHGLQPSWLLCPWDFPGKGTGVGCHFLLQGIFPTQESNLGLLHCRQTLYPLSHFLNFIALLWWRIICLPFWKTVCLLTYGDILRLYLNFSHNWLNNVFSLLVCFKYNSG